MQTTNEEIMRRAGAVRLLVLDVDGVLTDGRLYFTEDGGEIKCFDVRDGHGLRLLLHYDIAVAVVTARESGVVAQRMRELGIKHVHQGCRDKAAMLDALLVQLELGAEQTAYMGDDLIDLPAMAHAGLALAPVDACREAACRAHWISRAAGGRGAVREACELLLRAHGRWDEILG